MFLLCNLFIRMLYQCVNYFINLILLGFGKTLKLIV